MSRKLKVALIGNPNSGKTSLFNLLTGLKQKVGNFPGVTVEAKTGRLQLDNGQECDLIDLPGAYSLFPLSEDEKVLSRSLLEENDPYHPELILYVADIRMLDKQLLLLTQIHDLGWPVLVCLTNSDQEDSAVVKNKVKLLSEKLGLPVIAVSNRTGENLDQIRAYLTGTREKSRPQKNTSVSAPQTADLEALGLKPTGDPIRDFGSLVRRILSPSGEESLRSEEVRIQIGDTLRRYEQIDRWLAGSGSVQQTGGDPQKSRLTARLDSVLTHPIWGLVIFVGITFILFQLIFSFAQIPMDAIDLAFGQLSEWLGARLPESGWSGLITHGIIPGLAGVIVFIPQIALLFLMLTLLEEWGYMARVVYLLDHILSRFGLSGRSVIGLISGGACAIPAIMSARTISSKRQRLLTTFVIPLIPCSARIPVYAALVGFIVPEATVWGIFNQQGLVFTGLYLLGISMALVTAWAMNVVMKAKETSLLAMQLPYYQWPQMTQVWLVIYTRVKSFVLEAGKIIFMISICLWFLASFSFPGEMDRARERASLEADSLGLVGEQKDNHIEALVLESSFAGKAGRWIEPAIAPLGFDWKIGIALITSFAAREVFVGTMSTIYSLGPNSELNTLKARLGAELDAEGKPFFSSRRSLSLVLFYAFAMQCMSTLAVMKRETGSWRWALGQFFYMGALAWLASWLVWNVF